MNILAIESSSIVCGTALFLNNKLVNVNEIVKPKVHGECLPEMVNNILKDNSCLVRDLDGISVSAGPGSYTGLRIGMSLAKGIAMSGNIPIIPVPTLEAMNRGVVKKGLYWIILYSHKNIVFVQQFDSGSPISEIECVPFDNEKFFPRFGFNLDSICNLNENEIAKVSSKHIGELAIENFDSWARFDLGQITPNYISNFNIGKVTQN